MKNVLLLYPPASKVVDKHGEEFGETLTNFPKASLLQVASLIRSGVPDAELDYVDMSAESPEREEVYGSMFLGDTELTKMRVGSSFESIDEAVVKADVVGISCNHTFNAGIVGDLIKHIRNAHPKKTLVMGGNDVSFRPENYLEQGVDIVVHKRGDVSVPLLFRALVDQEPIENVPGIVFRDNSGKLVRTNYIPPNFSETPFPDLTVDRRYHERYTQVPEGGLPDNVEGKLGFMQTVLGCPIDCYFCTSTEMNGGFQTLSLEKTKQLIDHYWNEGTRIIMGTDDNFLLRARSKKGREEVIEIFEYMKEKGMAYNPYDGFQISLLTKGASIHGKEPDHELIRHIFSHHTDSNGNYIGLFSAYCPIEHGGLERKNLIKLLGDEKLEREILTAIAKYQPNSLHLGLVMTPESFKNIDNIYQNISNLIGTLRQASDYKTTIRAFPFCFEPLPGTRGFTMYPLAFDINKDPEAWNGYIQVVGGRGVDIKRFTYLRKQLQQDLNKLGG